MISTDRIGPRRWCLVRIHPNVEHLRTAAHRTDPAHDRDWWDECCGCFQPVGLRSAGNVISDPPNGYAGILRLAEGWRVTPEIVAHELVHAALQVYRMNVKADVRLGNGCREREEQLAYIYGELYADFERKYIC
jgi:hypothetical protein